MTVHRTIDDEDVTKRIVQRVSHQMIVEYGEAGAAFLHKSGPIGAAFARFVYFEVRRELEESKPQIERIKP